MSPSKDDPTPPPKIAIKGFSLSAKPSTAKSTNGKSSNTKLHSTLGKRPRSTFSSSHHDDHDSESEDEGPGHTRRGKAEVVTGFGSEGAIREHDKPKTEVLVIPKLANKDWKAEARGRQSRGGKRYKAEVEGGGKNLLPAEVQAEMRARASGEGGDNKGGKDRMEEGEKEGDIKWGLSVRKRVEVKGEGSADGENEEKGTVGVVKSEDGGEEEKTPQTIDEQAIAALLGEERKRSGPDLVIPVTNAIENHHGSRETELDTYRLAIASAPDSSTLEDYERIPVEEFGAALLRGMGWKGEKRGGVKEVKRRQNLLGLGAKELKDAEELGAWVQKSDVKRLRPGAGGDKGGGNGGRGDRKPKASEYRREEEERRRRREERGGGGYRDRDGRDSGRDRERERERERDYRDRDRERERDRRR